MLSSADASSRDNLPKGLVRVRRDRSAEGRTTTCHRTNHAVACIAAHSAASVRCVGGETWSPSRSEPPEGEGTRTEP